eukprot:15438861-Alexandrium_andersonii.AAC.1
MQNRFRRSELELRGHRNGRKIGPQKLPRGAFCAISCADSETADEVGDRGGPMSRTRRVASSDPPIRQSANPRDPW